MNKIISTSDRLFMAVCGPSCCGKTELIFQMLLTNTFYPKFKSIYYFYQHEQPKFSSIERNLNIFFTKFSGFDFISQLENCLLVFDDSCEEIFNDKEFSKLATDGRHRNISVIYVKHNLFQQSKWSRTIDLNTTHIIYWFLSQIFIAIKLRFPSGKFYAKGKEKSESLQTLLQKEVVDLDTLLCPKVDEIFHPIKHFSCTLHAFNLPEKQKKKHCAKRKAEFYFYWLTLPTNEPSSGEGSSFSSSNEFISKFDSMQLRNE